MSRTKISPEFFTFEQLAACSPSARLLFIGLSVFSDDRGFYRASVIRLKMDVFPADVFTAADMQRMVDELIDHQLMNEVVFDDETFWHLPHKGRRFDGVVPPETQGARVDIIGTSL
jgi:hypothetical protein